MFNKIPLRFLVGAAIFLFTVLLGFSIRTSSKEELEPKKISISDALLLNKNLKNALNVYKEITPKKTKADTLAAEEIWYVPNGDIPKYMLRASKEIERCNGTVHWMREIRDGRALLKYEGAQGVYPLTEIRITDSMYVPNSSKMAVVLAVTEKNKIIVDKPEILNNLNFAYNLLIPSSRPELLAAGKKLNANIIPWVPMESYKNVYDTEKRNQIPIGITEKELAKKLDEILKRYGNASGFAAFNGENFLVHQASVEKFANVLFSKKLWFWDLTIRGTSSLSPSECFKKDLRCRKDYLDAEDEKLITNALKTARQNSKAVLLFELTEKSIALLKNLPTRAEKQGTVFTTVEEIF
jgi:polysaccharide deacetylase 2 family uncharacterized protein YibQ